MKEEIKMKNNQMQKKYYIPLIFILITCIFMLLAFLIPYSRYFFISNQELKSNSSLSYYLAFVSTIGEIALYGILISLCVLELFTSKLFAYKLELTSDLIFLALAYVLELIYVISFSSLDISFGGIPFYVIFILLSILFIISLCSSIYYVYIPFRKIEKEAVKIQDKWNEIEEENNKKKEESIKNEIKDINTKENMKEYLKKKYENGELSKEKYIEFLIDLDGKN